MLLILDFFFLGLTRTETAFFLPQHTTEREELKPQLGLLLSHFSISYDVEELRDTAQEMELFNLVLDGLFLNKDRCSWKKTLLFATKLDISSATIVSRVRKYNNNNEWDLDWQLKFSSVKSAGTLEYTTQRDCRIDFSAEFKEKSRLESIVDDINVASIWQICITELPKVSSPLILTVCCNSSPLAKCLIYSIEFILHSDF